MESKEGASASPPTQAGAAADPGGQYSGGAESAKAAKNISASRVICHSILNSINKTASQIKKPLHRRSVSPLNWFPRKKTDSLLNRKIKILQETGGMKSSLDETLGDSNPHYCRIEREKMAAREAAQKAMEARKDAMVEASWCRILRAARIPSKEAEYRLELAEKNVEKAFEEATAMGVIMYDKPDCPRRPSEVETSPTIGGKATHTVAASFETAFEVDKEVAAAVKRAFLLLAHDPSSDKEEFRDLLRKISQNPDQSETKAELSSLTLESDADAFSPSLKSLVVMMLDRLKCLKDDELASLATIVATCGLNAALHGADNSRHHYHGSTADSFLHGQTKTTQAETELPSLDKFLVKHVSRLEKEVQEAKAAKRRNEMGENVNKEVLDGQVLTDSSRATADLPGLDKFLVKHVSKLEREVQKAKAAKRIHAIEENTEAIGRKTLADQKSKDAVTIGVADQESKEIDDTTTLPRAMENCGDRTFGELQNGETMMAEQSLVSKNPEVTFDVEQVSKDYIELNLLDSHSTDFAEEDSTWPDQGSTAAKPMSRIERAKQEAFEAFSGQQSLDTLLVKHASRLEKEKMAVKAKEVVSEKLKNNQESEPSGTDGLDKVFKKHLSRLDREKMALIRHVSRLEKENMAVVSEKLGNNQESEPTEIDGLDKVLKKHVSRLEREKMALTANGDHTKYQRTKKETEAIDSEGLDKVLVKHVSRLEKEKMAAQSRQGEVVKKEKTGHYSDNKDSLGEILVRHQSTLDKEKQQSMARQQQEDGSKQFESRREARERELMEVWGGLSLGNSVKPHLSRLEQDKAAWKRAEEEERRRAREL